MESMSEHKKYKKKRIFYEFSANVFNLIKYFYLISNLTTAALPLLSHKKWPQAPYDGIFLWM